MSWTEPEVRIMYPYRGDIEGVPAVRWRGLHEPLGGQLFADMLDEELIVGSFYRAEPIGYDDDMPLLRAMVDEHTSTDPNKIVVGRTFRGPAAWAADEEPHVQVMAGKLLGRVASRSWKVDSTEAECLCEEEWGGRVPCVLKLTLSGWSGQICDTDCWAFGLGPHENWNIDGEYYLVLTTGCKPTVGDFNPDNTSRCVWSAYHCGHQLLTSGCGCNLDAQWEYVNSDCIGSVGGIEGYGCTGMCGGPTGFLEMGCDYTFDNPQASGFHILTGSGTVTIQMRFPRGSPTADIHNANERAYCGDCEHEDCNEVEWPDWIEANCAEDPCTEEEIEAWYRTTFCGDGVMTADIEAQTPMDWIDPCPNCDYIDALCSTTHMTFTPDDFHEYGGQSYPCEPAECGGPDNYECTVGYALIEAFWMP